MAKQEDLRETALAAIRSEKRIGPHFKPETLTIDADGVATIESEVETVAIKRLALERLGGVPGIGGIVDRLRVKPASPLSDHGILDHLRKTYYQEPAFQQFAIAECEKGQQKLARAGLPGADGQIDIERHYYDTRAVFFGLLVATGVWAMFLEPVTGVRTFVVPFRVLQACGVALLAGLAVFKDRRFHCVASLLIAILVTIAITLTRFHLGQLALGV